MTNIINRLASSVLQAILDAAQWRDAEIHPIPGGLSNWTFKMKRDHFETALLRVSSELNGWETERHILGLIEPHIPAPRLLASGKTEGYGWLLTSYLPGITLAQCGDVSGETYYSLGRALAQLHSIRMPEYGSFPLQVSNTRADWRTLMDARFVSEFKYAQEFCTLSSAQLQSAKRIYRRFRPANGAVPAPCIIHRDVRPDNIIVSEDGKRLVGLVDFERSQSGEAIWDFAKLTDYLLVPRPESAEHVMAGYADTLPVPDLSTLPAYRFLVALGAVQWGSRHDVPFLVEEGKRQIQRLMSEGG